MATAKTGAIRLLERLGVPFELQSYEVDPEDLAAETVARHVGLLAKQVRETPLSGEDKHGVCLAVVGDRVPDGRFRGRRTARVVEL